MVLCILCTISLSVSITLSNEYFIKLHQHKEIEDYGAVEMAQWLGVLVASSEDACLIPGIHMETHNHLQGIKPAKHVVHRQA